MRFEFAAPRRIVFGADRADEAGEVVGALGRRALLVTGGDPHRARSVREPLEAAGIHCEPYAVRGEPTVAVAEEAADLARETACDVVVSVGGGSVLDTGKAAAALSQVQGPTLDYLEVVGEGRPLDGTPLSHVAVPTTAGTGSEATRNAVLGVPDARVKVSLRDPAMVPAVALVDPALATTASPAVTAASGLDALTQLIEPLTSHRASPMTDALCREALPRVARSLRRAVADGEDLAARADMALASLHSGLALANAGLGAVHGLAGPLGGVSAAPHGAVCGRLLPDATQVNVRALRERAPDSPALVRYREAAALLTGDPEAAIEDGINWLRALVDDLEVPRLGAYALGDDDIDRVVEAAARASSMRGNPVELTAEERREILERAR